jgi:hypothetical protein
MRNMLNLRLDWNVPAGGVKWRGLTFESVTDTLSQHRANFSSGGVGSAEMLSPIYKVDDENSGTIG